MSLIEYQQIKFVSGPFAGLLGRTRLKVEGSTNWWVEVMIAGRPVQREVTIEEIEPINGWPDAED